MSNRTLIEINHDLFSEIKDRPQEFVDALLDHLRATNYRQIPHDIFPGVRVHGVRHHSEPYQIIWGTYEAKQP